jgi:hypothetical protein
MAGGAPTPQPSASAGRSPGPAVGAALAPASLLAGIHACFRQLHNEGRVETISGIAPIDRAQLDIRPIEAATALGSLQGDMTAFRLTQASHSSNVFEEHYYQEDKAYFRIPDKNGEIYATVNHTQGERFLACGFISEIQSCRVGHGENGSLPGPDPWRTFRSG